MPISGAGAPRFVVDVGVEGARAGPEALQRTAVAGVVPDAGRHRSPGARHPGHLADAGGRIGHEVDDELGQSDVELGVCEREVFSRAKAHVDPRAALPGGSRELLRGVDGGDRRGAQAASQLDGQGAGATADIEHPVTALDAGEIGEPVGEGNRIRPMNRS